METEQVPAASCDYCGHENPDGLHACPGCGTPLVNETQPEQKSKAWAYAFAVVFGPLGLLYIRAWWPAFVLVIVRAPFLLTHTATNLWVMLGIRFFSVITVWHEFSETEPSAGREANRLLDEAAKLERNDRAAATAAYQNIIRDYPGTSASSAASRNIKVLSRELFPRAKILRRFKRRPKGPFARSPA